MPRTILRRRVCAQPCASSFAPEPRQQGEAALPLEGLEALRLCDMEGLPQESAAHCMGVSRATFQRILYAARHTVADALLSGKRINIGGGNAHIASQGCTCAGACAHCRFQATQGEEEKHE